DNMPLGFSEQENYRQVAFPLAVGDVLIFYSDGLTEARNAEGEFFGVDRLLEVIRTQHSFEPERLIDTIRGALFAFSSVETFTDDLTCVVVMLEETKCDLTLRREKAEWN